MSPETSSVAMFALNAIIWGMLTALLGGGMALIGYCLVLWSLYPLRSTQDAVTEDSANDLTDEDLANAAIA